MGQEGVSVAFIGRIQAVQKLGEASAFVGEKAVEAGVLHVLHIVFRQRATTHEDELMHQRRVARSEDEFMSRGIP